MLIQTIILFLVAQLTQPKIFSTEVHFSQFKTHNGWLYLTKMSLEQGEAQIKLHTERIVGISDRRGGEIVLNLIPQRRWKQQQENKCNRPILSPIIVHELILDGSSSLTHTSIKIDEQDFYYFVLKDCAHHFKKQYQSFDLLFKLELDIQNNGQYMGQEEDHWAIGPVIIGLGLYLILSNKDFLKQQFQSDPDYAKLMAFGTLAANMSSLLWKSFGYLIYRNFGLNYLFFHLIYLFMHAVSESLVLSLLVLVSLGWSINYLRGPQVNIAIPVLSLVLVLNVSFTLMTQLSNSQHDMHHTFDAYSGKILVFMRVIIGVGFLISVAFTYSGSRCKVKNFLVKFSILGSLFIFAMPLLVLVANTWLPSKDRNQFVFISVEVVKSICNILLIHMLGSSQSEYNSLAYKNGSFLPMQTGLF